MHLQASYLGLSSGLEAGAAAEAVVARGVAALGEAAAGGWAEAGSRGVAAWLVHTGACSIGVLMRWDQKRQQVKGAPGPVGTLRRRWGSSGRSRNHH
jgi:hypothetical protein